jgi:tRNA(Ile)-lysidine synthase
VSGGGDSMALALLAQGWAQASGRTLRTVTVDHRLRPDSGDEARRVGAWLAARGIAHDILIWDGEKPRTAIQAAARDARYRLIGAWAGQLGIRHVLTAHQIEDQAETFLMRLARGSGITGLAGMRDGIERDGVRLCRPLLGIARARLRATLRAAGQDWIEDPSNESEKFTRTTYRRLVAALADRGTGAERLVALAEGFARLDALMDTAARRFLGEGAIRAPGLVTLPRAAYMALPEPVAMRVLRDVLAEIGGRARLPLAPRGDRLTRAVERLREPVVRQQPARVAFTLGGCRIVADRRQIRVSPEAGRRAVRSADGFSAV